MAAGDVCAGATSRTLSTALGGGTVEDILLATADPKAMAFDVGFALATYGAVRLAVPTASATLPVDHSAAPAPHRWRFRLGDQSLTPAVGG